MLRHLRESMRRCNVGGREVKRMLGWFVEWFVSKGWREAPRRTEDFRKWVKAKALSFTLLGAYLCVREAIGIEPQVSIKGLSELKVSVVITNILAVTIHLITLLLNGAVPPINLSTPLKHRMHVS